MKKEIYKYEFARDRTIAGIINTIETFNMVKDGDKILISVSGGPDSAFLTHLFYLLQPIFDLTLYGFCLDHMTRAGESAKDSLFVQRLYKELGIKLFSRRIDVKKWCKSNKLSFQKGARKLRLKNLIEISKKKDINKIAVGHNADDNIETFLMHLIRGAGARGLSGMKPVSGKFIRPLINTFRDDIIAYLDSNKISYCVDRTNIENIYFRNRIRNIIIPFIEKESSMESFKSNVQKSIDILRDENEFLREYSLDKLLNLASIGKDKLKKNIDLIRIPVLKMKEENLAIQRRIILSVLELTGSTLEDINFKNIEDILKICTSGGESKVVYPEKGLRVFKIGSYIYFINAVNIKNLPVEVRMFLSGSGDTGTRDSEKEIKIGTIMRLKGFNLALSSELLRPDRDKVEFAKAIDTEAFLDYEKIKPPLKVRIWRDGDLFYPLGMNEEKKLQDFFTDTKVPLNLRKLVPVFTDNEKIVWIGNYRIDNRVRVTKRTKKVLHLKLFQK